MILLGIIVTGGTDFIGSHLVDFLVNKEVASSAVVLDDLSAGDEFFLVGLLSSEHFIEQ